MSVPTPEKEFGLDPARVNGLGVPTHELTGGGGPTDRHLLDPLATLSVRVRNFVLVTHAVPAARVRAHLPAIYELQTFGLGGREMALVTATCFCNEDFRWSMLPYPRHTFNETTYRTYVNFRGKNGVYFFGRYLGTTLATSAQRILTRDVWHADFDVQTELGRSGYTRYTCHATSDAGETSFSVSATDRPFAVAPFASAYEHEQFLTYRLHGFFTSSAGIQGQMPVGHRRMKTWGGELHAGRFELWERLGIVEPDEVVPAHSVLVEPSVHFRLYPPRPAL